MKIAYKNNLLEDVLAGVRAVASFIAVASFALLFGFYDPPVPEPFVFAVQSAVFFVFLGSSVLRLLNARFKREYLYANWYDIPALLALAAVMVGARRWFGDVDVVHVRHLAVAIYLMFEVTIKFFLLSVRLAATGRNPSRTLVASFVVLIVTGAALLMLPKATTGRTSLRPIDALFTSTSATCVTGLVVADTGSDFTFMGQVIILVLIQLGALGIVVFGAVFALLLGQALTLRETVAMQDLLSTETASRIGSTILFIFVVTVIVEGGGALSLYGMWDNVPTWDAQIQSRWFFSIFHSISAFCNAGFDLLGDSLIRYDRQWQVYGVICPLIVLGGLGFGVLHNLVTLFLDRVRQTWVRRVRRQLLFSSDVPKRMRLQSKIALSVSALLILAGAVTILLLERFSGSTSSAGRPDILAAVFQSVTARTAGFNTVPIGDLTPASQFLLILLMLVGGSPGSTAGGIKTVTLAVILMTVVAALRKRGELEMFHRSIRVAVLRRAVTIVVMFVVAIVLATLALTITERSHYPSEHTLQDLAFEVVSAICTVGLSTGVTPALTDAGKLIIIAVMLFGRLGPLTVLATLTFNLRPVRYSYPEEVVIVG
ncbi:MAG: Trk family potassium uptake protein [Phycisphaerae bacterium]|nr:Trk family potassium uptake protein [Phycisphaerae bacterium]